MLNFAIIKLCLSVIAGILLGFYFRFSIDALTVVGTILILLLCFSYYRSPKLLIQDSLFGIVTILTFLFLGIFSVSVNLPQNQPTHYINQSEAISLPSTFIIAEVSEKLKPGLYQDKYIVKVKQLEEKQVKGKLLLNISRDSSTLQFEVGKKMAISGKIDKINSPLNPYQFNYSDYMENLGVLRQINAYKNQVFPLEKNDTNPQSIAGNVRSNIIKKLRTFEFKPDELAIMQALLLGQRQEVSQEIYTSYAAAGVIHILAVSGLHVGIILLILNRILQPVERLWKGKILKTIFLLVLLWGFAILAGLSPSVIRAVSMFSFVAIGMQLKRRTSILNTLFTSLLILLLINPYFLSQVGFQLSYAAVFAIVLIQPHFYELYKGESKIVKYFWGILTVTFAAQIGVLPLSLFYFHQFPGLFFLSNLVILPFLGIILGIGILVMILALLSLLPQFLAEIFGGMISTLNTFVAWTASKEDFIFQNISFSILLCITSYFVILAFIFLLKKFSYRYLFTLLVTIIVFQAAIISEKFSAEENEALVFHKSRNTVIGIKNSENLELFHNLETTATKTSFIKDYQINQRLSNTKESQLKNIYEFSGKTMLQIDSSGIYKIEDLKPQIVLLTNSPNLNLERMLLHLNPEVIIADGSNYPSEIKRWKETAIKRKIPFHATAEKGAFISETDQNRSKGINR